MAASWDLFAAILLANAVLAGAIAAQCLRRRHAAGQTAFGLMMAALAVWAFGYAMEAAFQPYEAKVFWIKFENLGIATISVLWFIFCLQFTQQDRRLTRRTIPLLFIIPAITLFLLYSGRWASLHYAGLAVYSDTGGPLVVERGPWYWIQLGYHYLLMLGGSIALITAIIRFPAVYRGQAAVLLAGLGVMWAANLYYSLGALLGSRYSTPLDFTPIAFVIVGAIYGIGIFRFRLFDLMPVASDIVLGSIPEMVMVLDLQDRVVNINATGQVWIGKPEREIIGKNIDDSLGALSREFATLEDTFDAHQEITLNGNPTRTLDFVISPLNDHFGRLLGRVVVARDVTARKETEIALHDSDQRMRALLDTSPDTILITDASGNILNVNLQTARTFGYEIEEIRGRMIEALVPGIRLEAASHSGGPATDTPLHHQALRGHHKDGHQIPLDVAVSAFRTPLGHWAMAIMHDLTIRKQMEDDLRLANDALRLQLEKIEALKAQLNEQAIRDPLTGLFNRRYLSETLRRDFERSVREDKPISLVLLDIDHFKKVNDTYGHEAGDAALKGLSDMLASKIRRSDMACRYGGEEFVVILVGAQSEFAALRAESWRRELELQPAVFQGQPLRVTISVGVASFPAHGTSPEALLRAADEAMYYSKTSGRNRVTIYSLDWASRPLR